MRTVSQLDRLLGEYTAPDKSFVSRLNQVLVKLYPMGPWRELRTEWSVDVSSGYICLPPDYECLLAGNLQDGPIVIQDMMLEYESMGLGAVYRPVSHGIGMIDRGYVPVMSNLPAEGLETLTFTLTLGAFVTGAAITVNYITFDGAETQTLSPTSGTAVTLTPVSSNILAITGISYSNLTARVLAQADDSDANTITYAILLPGENSCQFRRYDIPQVPASPTDQWLLRGVVKRAFLPVVANTDWVHLDNITALKHGLLAVLAEDKADWDRSPKHWNAAEKALNDSLKDTRGGVQSHPQVHVWGLGVAPLSSRY